MQAGDLDRKPGDVGITEQTIAFANQPKCGGFLTPSINLMQRTTRGLDSSSSFKPVAKVEGPCIFGGCSELCCKSEFQVSTLLESQDPDDKLKIGDLAKITKMKPRSCSGCAREMFTDSDHFMLEYKQGVGLTPQQKAAMMGTVLLMDYMLFEQDNGMLECKRNKLYITLFDCYCCGVTLPCQIVVDGNNGGG